MRLGKPRHRASDPTWARNRFCRHHPSGYTRAFTQLLSDMSWARWKSRQLYLRSGGLAIIDFPDLKVWLLLTKNSGREAVA